VTRHDFQTFVGALAAGSNSVMAIDWAPRVSRAQRDAFERRLARRTTNAKGIVERSDEGQMQTAKTRDIYFPAEYIVGSVGVKTDVLGFDHASDPVRWKAMLEAANRGSSVATNRLPLFTEPASENDRFGVLVVQPVYAKSAPSGEARHRIEHVEGFILGMYAVPDIVDRAFADFTDRAVNCRLTDATEPDRSEPLHLHLADLPGDVNHDEDARRRGLIHRTTVPVPGREWIAECWPTSAFMSGNASLTPLFSLLGGLFGTALMGLFIWIVDGRADAVELLVVERTAELRETNRQLQEEVRERMAAEATFAEHARNLEETNRQLELTRVELQRQASIDALTGVLNRLSSGERMASEWNRACQINAPLSCVLLDVDFFKKVNDTYGHPVGDAVLKSLAGILREQAPRHDCLSRYGGEEFCIVLPDTSEEDAQAWAERLRKLIVATPINVGSETVFITVSMGIAARTGDLRGPEDLLDQADEALLVAKRQGRNRLVAFSELHRLDTAAEATCRDVFRGACAEDIMTPVLVRLLPSQSLQDAAQLLLCLRLDSVPVINEEGQTLGIIGEEDLNAQILSDQGWQRVVGDVMNTTPVTYDAETPAAEICAFLSRVAVRRVIIMRGGRPVGLISRSTLIRWLRNSLLSGQEPTDCEGVDSQSVVAQRLHSTIERLTLQIAALQRGVETSPTSVTPVVVSAATRIQELVDDALMLTADRDAQTGAGYATMGAVLS
jgi:diguanylate cyclase (GGDEF)-like protein